MNSNNRRCRSQKYFWLRDLEYMGIEIKESVAMGSPPPPPLPQEEQSLFVMSLNGVWRGKFCPFLWSKSIEDVIWNL